MFDFLRIKGPIDEAVTQARKLRNKIEQLKQQRDAMETLPLPREDYIALVNEYIDQRAEDFLHHFTASITRGMSCFDDKLERPVMESYGAF